MILFPMLSLGPAKSIGGASPVVFGPCTLGRTWGTRPGGGVLCFLVGACRGDGLFVHRKYLIWTIAPLKFLFVGTLRGAFAYFTQGLVRVHFWTDVSPCTGGRRKDESSVVQPDEVWLIKCSAGGY
jgi:hypothetical protein